MAKKQKLVTVIDMTGRKVKKTRSSESEHRVLVSREVYEEIEALRRHCTSNNRNDSVDATAMIQLAEELGLGVASYWIQNNRYSYMDGVFDGFTTDSTNYDRAKLKELRSKIGHRGSIEFVVDLLLDGGYKDKKEIAFELKKGGFCKDRSDKNMSKYVAKLIGKVKKLGYKVSHLGKVTDKRYVIKGANEELLKLLRETTKEKGEVIMSKKSKKTAKVEIKETAKKETAKKETAKKVEVKKPTPKKAAKKEAKPKKESIRDFVIKNLKQKARTKRELAEMIIKSGLTTSTEVDSVIKYLNVMFYKFRKNNVGLKCELKGEKSMVGYFSM